MERPPEPSPHHFDPISRRQLLRGALAGAAALGAGGLLDACGSSSPQSNSTATTSPTTAAGGPRKGGTLRLAMTGASSTDEINPLLQVTNVSSAMDLQVFDSLVAFDRNAVPQLSLADEVTPNADATEWTIRVKSGVTFHDGKPLIADDVIYTFQQIQDPKNTAVGAGAIATVDSANIKKLDNLTVRIPCRAPFSTLFDTLAAYYYFVIPVGFDKSRPIGTGPFEYRSFTPAVSASFARNDSYWGGAPYLDGMAWTFFPDESSQVNALLSGQADCVSLLSSASMRSVTSGGAVLLVSGGGGWTPFTMNCTTAPFTDVRVRQAFKLIVDRQQMREQVFLGNGAIGNDLFSIWDPVYDHAIPQRPHDPEQAKFLLKQAGHDGLNIPLVTSPVAQGTVPLAELFQQQAKLAGVNVTLQTEPVTTFYGPDYLKWGFAQDFWYYNPYFFQVAAAMLPSGTGNECHFTDQHYFALYAEALKTVDDAKRSEIAHEMQMIEWNADGYIIPYFAPVIDAHSKKVQGTVTTRTALSFNDFNFTKIWLT
ncbi:MAG: ABC transporter substrate-binding protein [Acidimicrobiales bacterium]